MNRIIIILGLIFGLSLSSAAQSAIVKEFQPVCDSLNAMVIERVGVTGELKLRNVMRRGQSLDFYFTESLGDYPWNAEDAKWFKSQLKSLFPENYRKYSLGAIYSRKTRLDNHITNDLGFDGKPAAFKHRKKPQNNSNSLVRRLDGHEFSKGLKDRNIAVWQSHGRYFDQATGSWIWQRPPLFQTIEDMFTQSFVLPYLVPMLENAGAYVLMPRERDTQTTEIIADFDTHDPVYGVSSYEEKGKWKDAGTGFAAAKATYEGTENPFVTGKARKIETVANGTSNEATALWRPDFPQRGEYAVYISYKSLPESSTAAKYTVRHLGGSSEFIVNQKIGGGTWIYLGTFEFGEGTEGAVTLSNRTPEGYRHKAGSVVTADAVKFGGGMGNIARKISDSEDVAIVSGLPRSAEGARYWLQWSGADSTLFSQNEHKDDYKDDYMSRGDWVEWISRGSYMNPSKKKGLGIPVDLTFGFHSDAGITPNDSIVGTLAIYTLASEGKEKLPGGESRMTSREFANLVQSQIVNDVRREFNPEWTRRSIWDRSYRESRTPSSPSMLLELLSHQNFADMKYGLDPTFRFTVSRAVYKGMLKYLSNRYGEEYAVQPLPVQNLGIRFAAEDVTTYSAVLSWKETEDPVEPTAKASGFILYTRLDDGGFDTGRKVSATMDDMGTYSTELSLEKGHIYSFRIAAANEGGRSFPSETVSIGMPTEGSLEKKVLIVNNFDRVSGPAFIDTPTYAGFDNRLDSGVPHIKDIAFVGETHEFRRNAGFITNDNPGFGASHDDYAGRYVAGNTFDYPYVHGKSIMKAGYPFYSCSNESFASDSTFVQGAWAADLVCGKQVTTVVGSKPEQKFSIFPYEMQNRLKEFTASGGHVLISGANIATDVWDGIYPVQIDKTYRAATKKFVTETLGYQWVRNSASRSGEVRGIEDGAQAGMMEYHNETNSETYCVESPDGISPVSSETGSTFMVYPDSRISAGVLYEGKGYRTVSLGFPIETLKNEKDIDSVINITLEFFNR